jgi:pimeloyl-ACP methyl ester carboxylesterase
MRYLSLALLIGFGLHSVVGAASPSLASTLWNGFFDRNKDDATLIQELAGEHADVASLESALEAGPVRPPIARGVYKVPVTCRHVDYSTEYFLAVPSDYDPSKKYPLVFVMHGGDASMSKEYATETARRYLAPWLPYVESRHLIAVAPITERGWRAVGLSLTQSVRADVFQRLNIDENRVYMWGQSMGGNASWRAAVHTPDEFAGVAPVEGGYDYGEQMITMINMPFYHVWGDLDEHPAGFREINRKNAAFLKGLGFNVVSVERHGGHWLFEDEIPKILDFLLPHSRSFYPRVAVASHTNEYSQGPLQVTIPDPGYGWSSHQHWTRPMPVGAFYWIQMQKKIQDQENGTGKAATMIAMREDNQIHITRLENVEQADILISGRQFDLNRVIFVSKGDDILFHGKVTPSWKEVIRTTREFEDPSRVFEARLTLKNVGGKITVEDTTLR